MIKPWDIAGAVQESIMDTLGVSWQDMRRGGCECFARSDTWHGYGEWYMGEVRQEVDGGEVSQALRERTAKILGWSDEQTAAAKLVVEVGGHDEKSGRAWVNWSAELSAESATG